MQRLAQCAILGAAVVLAGMHLDRPGDAPRTSAPPQLSVPPASAAAPAVDELTAGEIRAFLVRNRITHDLDLQALRHRINGAASRHGVEPAMLLAVIRVESTFRPEAISHKGALGLMQILPGTGEALAKEMGLAWQGEHQLLEPDLNIEMGAYYLGKLLNRFGGDPEAALEAYFQGPTRLAARRRTEPAAPMVYASRVLPYWEQLR